MTGKAYRIKDGKDVAIIANGDTVRLAITAAQELAKKGITVENIVATAQALQ